MRWIITVSKKFAIGSLAKRSFESGDDLDIDEVAIAERALAMDEMFDLNSNAETLLETRALDKLFRSL
jgi:hypothetical protein